MQESSLSSSLLLSIPYHITPRGVDGRETFSSVDDRNTYLELLRQNLADTEVRLLGWCLMTNHVHVIAVPTRAARTGHLWQNRFFACILAEDHLWTALAYIERNPLRARLVGRAEHYVWSSAVAHVTGRDGTGLLDMDWWHKSRRTDWRNVLNRKIAEPDHEAAERDTLQRLRACTYAGRPFGDDAFVDEMSKRFQRHWVRGRPAVKPRAIGPSAQYQLFRPNS